MIAMPSMSLRNRQTLGKSSALTEHPIHWKNRYCNAVTGMPTASVLNTLSFTNLESFSMSSWNFYARRSQNVNVQQILS